MQIEYELTGNGQKKRVMKPAELPEPAENPVRTQEEVWPEYAEAVHYVVSQGHSAESAKFLVKKFGPAMILSQKANQEIAAEFVEQLKAEHPLASQQEIENALHEQAAGSLLQREQE